MTDQPGDGSNDKDSPSTPPDGRWREDAYQWYSELKGEEHAIAPWLSLEWTGERMRVRRG